MWACGLSVTGLSSVSIVRSTLPAAFRHPERSNGTRGQFEDRSFIHMQSRLGKGEKDTRKVGLGVAIPLLLGHADRIDEQLDE